jgi:hypothetical protein
VNEETLPDYYKAKVEADEHLAALAWKRRQRDEGFQDICLRPGTLTDGEAGGVMMGRLTSRGKVSRESVARVAAELLGRDDTRGWYDLLDGERGVKEAVDKLVTEGFDGIEGEDLGRIYGRA